MTLLSGTTLSELLTSGQTTSAEIVSAHLVWIAEQNPAINALVQLAEARASDEARHLGQGPRLTSHSRLRGLPFTVKDNFETQGLVTAIGVPERKDEIPDRDASLVAHVRRQGGVLLGKTNCPPWGAGIITDNEVYGRTNNPYDLGRSPGGSSGGEAAAIAAGLSPFGFGTDSGGSVRIPAHFCGVAALLPTARTLPVTGVIDNDGPIGVISDPRTRVGIMARSVNDLWLVLDSITPARTDQEEVPPWRPADSSVVSIRDLRIALHTANGIVGPDADTIRTVLAAGQTLESEGADIEERLPPEGGHDLTMEVWRSYDGETPSRELYQVMRRWDALRVSFAKFFGQYDAIVCPVFDTVAPLHDEETDGLGISYTSPYSLTDCPVAVVRCGTSQDRMPIGVQVVGRPWRDDVVVAIATHLEGALGGWSPPPLVGNPGRFPAEPGLA
jgi:amidase